MVVLELYTKSSSKCNVQHKINIVPTNPLKRPHPATTKSIYNARVLFNISENFQISLGHVNFHHQSDIRGWEVRLILFNALMVKCCFTEWKCGVVLTSNVFTQTNIGSSILNFLNAIRNKCSSHRGARHAKHLRVYYKSQEYALSQIAKTNLEHRI